MATTNLKLKDNCHFYLKDLYTTDSSNKIDNVKKVGEIGNRVLLSYAGDTNKTGGFKWSNSNIGSSSQPIFINSKGQLQASSINKGENGNPIYLKDGVITAFTNFFVKTARLEKTQICRFNFSQGSGTGILIIAPAYTLSKNSFSKRVLLLKKSATQGAYFSAIESASTSDFPVVLNTNLSNNIDYKISNNTQLACDIVLISFSPVEDLKVSKT